MSGGICGENVTWHFDGKILTISGAGKINGDDLSAELPERESIERLVIEAGVTAAENFAFGFCDNLRRAELPDSFIELGTGAFLFCGKLKEIKLSANLAAIGKSTFCGCWSLERIKLPEKLTAIEADAFSNCAGLRAIKIPAGVKTIGNKAFRGCERLEEVELPADLERIGNNAFENCESLKTITIPARVKEIGDGVLNRCANLKTVYCAEGCGFEDILRAGNNAMIIPTVAPVPDGLQWRLDGDTLTIIDADKLKSLSHDKNAPWYDKREAIKRVVIEA